MKNLFSLLLFIGAMTLGTALAQTADFYVATTGNDNNPGTLQQPFATFDHARQAADNLLQNSPGRTNPIIVMFRGGTYYLPAPVNFGATDSGTSKLQIIYENYPSETPVFSGGMRITNWKQINGNEWQATLPKTTKYFEQLWYNGQRRLRPRLGTGNVGTYYYIANPVYVGTSQTNCTVYTSSGYLCFDRFYYDSKDPITNTWKNLSPPSGNPCFANGNSYPPGDIQAVIFEKWSTSKLRVSCVDTIHHILYFTGPTELYQTSQSIGFTNPMAGHRYIIENVKDEFTQGGQWFLDQSSTTWTLNYLANANENPNNDTVIIPQQSQLVIGNYLKYVKFQGLTFKNDNWTVPSPGGYPSERFDQGVTGAIGCYNCQSVTFDTVTVTQTAGGGIEFYTNDYNSTTSHNTVQNSSLYDLGAFGIRNGLIAYYKDTDSNVPQHATVKNNAIAAFGRVIPSAIGIVQGDGHDNTYTHNDIFDGYHSGIELCAQGCFPGTSNSHGAFNNIMSFNHIYSIGQGMTDDMACIYVNTDPSATGNQILNNKCHDVLDASVFESDGYAGQAYYLDVNTSNVLIKNNIAYRVSASGVAETCGPQTPNTSNTITNNVFAFFKSAAKQQGCTAPASNVLQFSFTNNIVYYENYSNVQSGCNDPKGGKDTGVQKFSSNLYCYASDPNCTLPTDAFFTTDSSCGKNWKTLSGWQSMGQDTSSMVANPMFTNPTYPNDNFSLKASSPATQIGFVAFNVNAPGRTSGPTIPTIPATFVVSSLEGRTKTVLTSSLNPATYGQKVTITATITSEMGPPPSSETISLMDGSTLLANVPITNGVATYSTSKFEGGSHKLQATYNGDSMWSGSSSFTMSQKINKATTTTTLKSSPNPSNNGQVVTLTATVTSSSGKPTGSVTFKRGSTVMGTANLNSNGVATMTTSTIPTGTHSLFASYTSTTDYSGSTSPAVQQTVNK